MRPGMSRGGYTYVHPTPEECAEWKARPGSAHRTGYPYRVQCDSCGKRYWLSGIAVASHRRKCGGRP